MHLSPTPRYRVRPVGPFFLALGLCIAAPSWAQSPALTPPASAPIGQSAKGTPVEQRIEHIVLEDGGNRIEELRIGGETKSITVQPKGGLPAYEVQPENNAASANTTSGNRVWKILGF